MVRVCECEGVNDVAWMPRAPSVYSLASVSNELNAKPTPSVKVTHPSLLLFLPPSLTRRRSS